MLMFSATLNKNVVGLVKKYMNEPVFVDLTQNQKYKLPVNIQHHYVRAHNYDLADLVSHYLKEFKMDQCIIFTNMKSNLKRIIKFKLFNFKFYSYLGEAIKYNFILNNKDIRSSDLHSDLSQRKRQIILDRFRRGKIQVLVVSNQNKFTRSILN